MPQRADWVAGRREEAWAFGRDLRDDLLSKYQREYDVSVPPPPAKIVGELLTDFLGVSLLYGALQPDRFAETRYVDGRLTITVNERTRDIPGVKDDDGVQAVAMWHEGVHAVRDVDILRMVPQAALPGFEAPRRLVCYRLPEQARTSEEREREFWAEEAGRAAAVSLPALARTEPFRKLLRLGPSGPTRRAWPLLYDAAEQIGVNITALVKHLSLEGLIVVTREDGRPTVCVQPALLESTDRT